MPAATLPGQVYAGLPGTAGRGSGVLILALPLASCMAKGGPPCLSGPGLQFLEPGTKDVWEAVVPGA